ncbi:hypothetical protein DFH09DRAFT_1320311 [Mycena vulgaris]|nr:hypothetical protein DFH09DRAFT_1320311 [Mycena vulgaris]
MPSATCAERGSGFADAGAVWTDDGEGEGADCPRVVVAECHDEDMDDEYADYADAEDAKDASKEEADDADDLRGSLDIDAMVWDFNPGDATYDEYASDDSTADDSDRAVDYDEPDARRFAAMYCVWVCPVEAGLASGAEFPVVMKRQQEYEYDLVPIPVVRGSRGAGTAPSPSPICAPYALTSAQQRVNFQEKIELK